MEAIICVVSTQMKSFDPCRWANGGPRCYLQAPEHWPLTTSAGLENAAITCVLRNHFPVEFGHCHSLFTHYVKVDSCPDYPSTGFNLKTYVKIKQTVQKLFDIVIVILKSPIPEQWEHTLG